MSHLTSHAPSFDNKAFRKSMLYLMLPIAFQQFITAAVNTADVLMLGRVGQNAMSAVSLAGQITFVLTLFFMGLSVGVGTLTAQYWGKHDLDTIRRVHAIGNLLSATISGVFFLAAFLFPTPLMRVLTNDAILVDIGVRYLRVVSFSYLAMGFSQMYLAMLRSMENAKLSAWITSSSLVVNVVLNALSIYLLFRENNEKAVLGVACATVVARALELAFCLGYSKAHLSYKLHHRDATGRLLFGDFKRIALPVLANYLVYGGALTASAVIIGHVSADMVAANSVASVVRNLAIVLVGGVSGGGSVLVGKALGIGDLDLARRTGNHVSLYAFLFGVLAGITVLLVKPVTFQLVTLNATAMGYLDGMLIICAVYCIGKAVNSTLIGGIFCAGGDARFGFLMDAIVMWGIILPLAFLSAFVWHLSPVWIYAVICMDEFFKLPAAIIRYRQFKWLNNLTRDFSAPTPTASPTAVEDAIS